MLPGHRTDRTQAGRGGARRSEKERQPAEHPRISKAEEEGEEYLVCAKQGPAHQLVLKQGTGKLFEETNINQGPSRNHTGLRFHEWQCLPQLDATAESQLPVWIPAQASPASRQCQSTLERLHRTNVHNAFRETVVDRDESKQGTKIQRLLANNFI